MLGKQEDLVQFCGGEVAWGLFLGEISINRDLKTWRVGVKTGGSELRFLNLIRSGRLFKKTQIMPERPATDHTGISMKGLSG